MKIVLVAGGTGGHIFPAMAVADEIRQNRGETQLVWITTNRANEKEIAQRFSIEMLSLNVDGIKRAISFQPIKAIFKLVKAIFFMKKYFKTQKPDAVIAFGGYVCAPVLFAAKANKIPFFIQEQNTVAGAVNKFFAKDAKKIFLGMPLIKDFNAAKNAVVVTGTPVRKVRNYDNFAFPSSVDKSKRTILICGGSQGAMSMNKALIKAVKYLSQNDFQIIWQTGSAGENEIKKEFENDKNIAIFATFTDLYPYYSIAEILIGRAGASTISEARLFALPSIFIPLPWSAENHQEHNAQYAQKSGWALCFAQNEETSDKIIDFLETCKKDVEIYKKMKNCATENAANAAKIIAKTVLNNN
ncbi:MAG: undecaprenyldiphospho-muramoylpentapeptide beta-N-acetylglucosaminyltransferase [Chitinivibrionia bacterium]|nr:undecaprenyldiphospho-muramoylpentapeptide beta-N-acetylglucosaminyltransferase [Chitinivibrionia bacterium]